MSHPHRHHFYRFEVGTARWEGAEATIIRSMHLSERVCREDNCKKEKCGCIACSTISIRSMMKAAKAP